LNYTRFVPYKPSLPNLPDYLASWPLESR
jgi:hypothetical protein